MKNDAAYYHQTMIAVEAMNALLMFQADQKSRAKKNTNTQATMTQATKPKKQPKLTAIELYQMRKWNLTRLTIVPSTYPWHT